MRLWVWPKRDISDLDFQSSIIMTAPDISKKQDALQCLKSYLWVIQFLGLIHVNKKRKHFQGHVLMSQS